MNLQHTTLVFKSEKKQSSIWEDFFTVYEKGVYIICIIKYYFIYFMYPLYIQYTNMNSY